MDMSVALELARKQDVAALDQLELQLLRKNRVRPHEVDDEEGLFYHISDRFFPAEIRHADAGLRVVWGVMWHCIDCIFLLRPRKECAICSGVGFVEPHDYRVACITDIDGLILEDFLS